MLNMKTAPILIGSVLAFLFSPACYRANSSHPLREAMAHQPKSTKVMAVYVPWFGDKEHIKVGYTTDDPVTIKKQIAKAKEMGVDAFSVDWYGERRPFLDRSYSVIQRVAAEENFEVALMYDETEEDNGHATDDALAAMKKAYEAYLNPDAPGRKAYMEYQGRPVIFVFPKRGHTDWNIVREKLSSWPSPPLLIYKDEPPPQYAAAFDGSYAWVHPGKKWAEDGSDWGKEYLDKFYTRMQAKPNKITVGTVWPSFDDTKASWSLDRHISARCGKTFEDTLHMFQSYSQANPMPYLMIATWNDYEEGSAIERGIPNCSNSPKESPNVSGNNPAKDLNKPTS
jgi:hypothetical protein